MISRIAKYLINLRLGATFQPVAHKVILSEYLDVILRVFMIFLTVMLLIENNVLSFSHDRLKKIKRINEKYFIQLDKKKGQVKPALFSSHREILF